MGGEQGDNVALFQKAVGHTVVVRDNHLRDLMMAHAGQGVAAATCPIPQ